MDRWLTAALAALVLAWAPGCAGRPDEIKAGVASAAAQHSTAAVPPDRREAAAATRDKGQRPRSGPAKAAASCRPGAKGCVPAARATSAPDVRRQTLAPGRPGPAAATAALAGAATDGVTLGRMAAPGEGQPVGDEAEPAPAVPSRSAATVGSQPRRGLPTDDRDDGVIGTSMVGVDRTWPVIAVVVVTVLLAWALLRRRRRRPGKIVPMKG